MTREHFLGQDLLLQSPAPYCEAIHTTPVIEHKLARLRSSLLDKPLNKPEILASYIAGRYGQLIDYPDLYAVLDYINPEEYHFLKQLNNDNDTHTAYQRRIAPQMYPARAMLEPVGFQIYTLNLKPTKFVLLTKLEERKYFLPSMVDMQGLPLLFQEGIRRLYSFQPSENQVLSTTLNSDQYRVLERLLRSYRLNGRGEVAKYIDLILAKNPKLAPYLHDKGLRQAEISIVGVNLHEMTKRAQAVNVEIDIETVRKVGKILKNIRALA